MDDPFPASLPGYESPRIYDPNVTQAMEDVEENCYSSPNYIFGEHVLSDTGFSPTPLKRADNTPGSSKLADAKWAHSPESSSSSDSSNQHKRDNSSDSSAMEDLTMAATPMASGILIGADPHDPDTLDHEASNNIMAAQFFDFESAASSPTPIPTATGPEIRSLGSNTIKMPVRSLPQVGPPNSYNSASSGSSGSPDTIPLSMGTKNDGKRWSNVPAGSEHRHKGSSCSPSNLMMPDGGMKHGRIHTTWSGPNRMVPAVAPTPNFPQTSMNMPFASPSSFRAPNPSNLPKLFISNFPAKTRVESQHILKYTLDPLPPGITKLHLQPYTMSKPKLMAKPTPEKSPEMLEMYATVVCSSAMCDPVKLKRALSRAAGPMQQTTQQEARKSSSDSGSTRGKSKSPAEDDENKPLNGGPVHICVGCIERERKRANRKKVINQEEQGLWEQEEAKRTVVFNIQEIREWQQPSPPKMASGKDQSMPFGPYDVEPSFSSHAMQVDIPTRISCYCRHQEEKIGFQIIFTIRDYKDNFVAQAMSNSIMITDDHKTHPAPNNVQQAQVCYPDAPVPGSGVFQQGPHYPPFARNAFSAADLSRMNHNFDPRTPTQARPFAMPQETSEPTSTMLTPRNLSRPASPTSLSGQQNKRRKASGSGRIHNGLRMTKLSNLPTAMTSPIATTSMASHSHSGSTFASNTSAGAFSPNYAEPPGPLQYSTTNPPTPSTADGNFPFSTAWAQRSHSLENLALAQNMFSEPPSTQPSRQPSRVPSPRQDSSMDVIPPLNTFQPTSGVSQLSGLPHANGYSQAGGSSIHAQMLANSLQSVDATSTPQLNPVILALTPRKGPKAGGIQVTCLGTGFTQGLEVMFGDARATTTTFWGDRALVCLVPPASHAGAVPVTFKHEYDQNIKPPANSQQYFNYVDEDESEVMSLMINIMGHHFNTNNSGHSRDIVGEAREMAQRAVSNGSTAMLAGGSPHGKDHHYKSSSAITSTSNGDIEEALLRCLEQLDLCESPGQANLNYRGSNGQSILHLSASLGYYRVVAGLLARGAHPDLRDNNGMSPMHMAALQSNVRIIRKLRSAGGDPTLRSLNAFTPADMVTSHEAMDAVNALDHHRRSRSAIGTPISGISRAASVLSRASSFGEYSVLPQGLVGNNDERDRYRSQPVTPAHIRACSRRNSYEAEEQHGPNNTSQEDMDPNVSQLATQSALTAWRDQLSMQIQHFQQTVHRALPPLPNLPDYQDYPVVRRISSLVPQRNTQLAPPSNGSALGKETDYHWWELLTGVTSQPPAYEDIYPEKLPKNLDDRKAPIIRATGEAIMDQKCEAMFDSGESSAIMETVNIGSKGLTQHQQDRLRSAHAQKIKKLRSDRNLFFIWIPLLILVILAMLKDRAPQIVGAGRQTYSYLQARFQGRIEEIV